MPATEDSAVQPISFPLLKACTAIGVGKTRMYELISAGLLDARKSGNRTLITAVSLRAYVESLPKADIGKGRRVAELRAPRGGGVVPQNSR
jgi:hypothetical protein